MVHTLSHVTYDYAFEKAALPRMSSFIRVVHVLTEYLVHREHVDLVLLEYSSHPLVTADLAFVIWILQVIGSDMGPYALNNLRS